jgi:hypothetical protein
MYNYSANLWLRISLLSLLIVSCLGALMRYKIGFEFPYLDQKYLQHAHSHFAFSGWVSQTLMVLMVKLLQPSLSVSKLKRYQGILLLNIIASFGMLLAFAIQGYALFSISFSTLSIIVSFVFALFYVKDAAIFLSADSKRWLNAALLFNILSSLGTFALVIMMVTKNIPQHAYLASLYWFLHFQYNGWFFFAGMGLFFNYIGSIMPSIEKPSSIFWLFAVSCIPAYGLSTLWLEIPIWIYVIIVAAAIAQFVAWINLLWVLKKGSLFKSEKIDNLSKFLFLFVAIALSIKLSLQLGSTIPAISKLAFGFRPIVMAYLHLILLAVTSVFLIAYAYTTNLIRVNKLTIIGILGFIIGVFINELVLAVQGVASFSYTVVPYVNEILFGVAIFIMGSLLLLNISQFLKTETIFKA